jgi:hypothetical protein
VLAKHLSREVCGLTVVMIWYHRALNSGNVAQITVVHTLSISVPIPSFEPHYVTFSRLLPQELWDIKSE